MGQLDLSKKNWNAGKALLSLQEQLDIDTAANLSNYDRECVCVPQTCDCGQENCRYLAFLEECSGGGFPFHICNHNLLLADAIHHGTGRTPILLNACAIIIDEAHKLPETARQMFGITLEAQDIRTLIRSLCREKFLLAAEIAALLDAFWGHALVLFTPYAAMSAIKERLTEMDLLWNIFTLSRNAVHTTQQFKGDPRSVLLATGAAWEGFDFPGDCVSLLVIPRLPFSPPDALKEKKRAEYPDLRSFIRVVVVPEMQIKLKQGFGRAIRTETDTCVVAILDERAEPGQRHFEAMRAALPEMQVTHSLENVAEFIYRIKGTGYFKEGEP